MNIYILDVGTTKYGDCIIITQEGKTIMIDGAHPGDEAHLLDQIGTILQKQPPFNIDLLVVTHCHGDHIGCLPDLIENGDIVPARALVADEKLGFGRLDDGDGPGDDAGLTKAQKIMIMALQEEDQSDLPDDELEAFLQDAIDPEPPYLAMLQTMQDNGCAIIRYGSHTAQQIQSLETSFNKFGLKIIGPSDEHLVLCGQAIAGVTDSISQDAFGTLSDNAAAADLVSVYRRLMSDIKSDAGELEDVGSQASAAKNNQSIMIKVAADGWSALLAGDMQFAAPGVSGLNDLMAAALQNAVDEGPYDFIKLTHHTASNGLNQTVFNAFAPCKNFAHTGGIKDAGHPNKNVLEILKQNQSTIKFLRTDRNGRITVKKSGGKVVMTKSKGIVNDFTVNPSQDTEIAVAKDIQGKNVVSRQTPLQNGYIEITAKIPMDSPRVAIIVEIDNEKKKLDSLRLSAEEKKLPRSNALGGGRDFPPLLFVTCMEKLAKNVGTDFAQSAVEIIRSCKTATLMELPLYTNADEASKNVHNELLKGKYEGVVIVGGYDVIPSKPVDVLDNTLRAHILALKGRKDFDNFMVWSDDVYVDLAGDTLPDLPISRIPDGRLGDLLLAALTAPAFQPGRSFGVRNIERPFADDVYKLFKIADDDMFVSETFGPAEVEKDAAVGAVYFMLHGFERDATLYSGEIIDEEGGDNELFDAVSIDNVPTDVRGSVVFAGCCWGALTVFPKAAIADKHVLSPRSPEDSIALTYLMRGAQAFVGCTGTHYSPGQEPYNYYGKPMHDLFWKNLGKGLQPSRALFEAKKIYANEIPHDQMDVFSRGIEHKTLRQFTCLGLGW